MAAYNTGMGRLRNAMETQARKDFWRLDLIDEAERYVPRVIAAKIIMTRLAEYGFDLDEADGYAPEPVERLSLRLPFGRGVSLLEAARIIGIDYRTLRRLNPGLTDAALPTGRSFVLSVPPGRSEAARLLAGRAADSTPEDAPAARRGVAERRASEAKSAHHVVRRGDSLGAIAARHKVSVDELRRWNRLSRKDPIREGQKLIVRR
jgi:membrane-bound lytic murein transglycosylase D